MYVCVYIYVCVCVCVYIYIYIYTHKMVELFTERHLPLLLSGTEIHSQSEQQFYVHQHTTSISEHTFCSPV